jgi:hypothetical protein
LGGPESKRRERFTAAASMATTADSWALGRVQGKSREGFYRPTVLQGSFTRASLATVVTAWPRWRLAMCGYRRTMEGGGARAGKCAEAAWHRPSPLARVTDLSCTVPTALGFGPAVACRPRRAHARGYGGGQCGARGATSRGCTCSGPNCFK